MSKDYNATIELGRRGEQVTDDQVDELMEMLKAYHVAVGTSARGWLEVVVTLPADDLEQATTTAIRVVGHAARAGDEPISAQVLTTQEYDARAGFVPVPEMMSTTEVAEQLGVSRQRVLQLAHGGQLQATKSGRDYSFPRTAVEAFAARDRKVGRPAKSST